MSVFSLNLNVLQAWNSCLGVLPILEYCYWNLFCNAGQSSSNGANINFCFYWVLGCYLYMYMSITYLL